MKLIKLTYNGAQVYVNPANILYFYANKGKRGGTYIDFSHGSLLVFESVEEIGRLIDGEPKFIAGGKL